MGVADPVVAVVVDNVDQSSSFRFLDRVVAGETTEDLEIERFAEGQQLQGLQHLGREVVDAMFEERREFGGDGGAAPELPHVPHPAERAGLAGADHEMVDEQGVPTRGLPDQVGAQLLQGTTEHGLDEIDALLPGER